MIKLTDPVNLYLIADNSGEVLLSIARGVIGRFEQLQVREYLYPLVRTKKQLDRIAKDITSNGVVMYVITDDELRGYLKSLCVKNNIPHISVLSHPIVEFASVLNLPIRQILSPRRELDDSYFHRLEAINYAISHDDSQSFQELHKADIILFGVSRTSKSPTSIFLANRGYFVANIPVFPGQVLPESVLRNERALKIGLMISPERLAEIRSHRNLGGNMILQDYCDITAIEQELFYARRLFVENNITMIDISKRSIEEITALIMAKYQEFTGEILAKD